MKIDGPRGGRAAWIFPRFRGPQWTIPCNLPKPQAWSAPSTNSSYQISKCPSR